MPAHKAYMIAPTDGAITFQLMDVHGTHTMQPTEYDMVQPLTRGVFGLRVTTRGTAAMVPTRPAKYTPYGSNLKIHVLLHPAVQPLPLATVEHTKHILYLYARLRRSNLSLCTGHQFAPHVLCTWNGVIWLHPRAWDMLCYDPDGILAPHTAHEVLRAALWFNSIVVEGEIESAYMVSLPWPLAVDLFEIFAPISSASHTRISV